jgi:hypothetical protein
MPTCSVASRYFNHWLCPLTNSLAKATKPVLCTVFVLSNSTMFKLLRESHGESHNALEQLCSLLNKLIMAVVELEDKQFSFLHQQLRRMLVLAGCRDHIAEFRQEVFADIREQHPEVAQQYPNLGSLMDALQQEFADHRAGRIPARPLNTVFCDSVHRLGLTTEQWRQLKAMNSGSISAFHSKFSLEELKTEVFPEEFKACRFIVIKVAEVVKSRREATGAVPQEQTPDDANDFF